MKISKNYLLFFALICLIIATAIPAFAEEEVNFGGKTVTIIGWGGPRDGRFKEGGDAEGLDKEAEDKFNCTIEFDSFSFGGYADGFMTRLLAGDSINDIWLMQQRQFWQLIAQGAFYPVGEVLPEEYYENLPTLSRNLAKSYSYQGKTYGFGVDYGAIHPMEVCAYNKDLFEREGLPDLYELYKEGEWTWDKATEIAQKATRDTNGDGEIDQWGINNPRGTFYASMFAFANGARVTRVNENGRIIFTYDEPRALKGLQQLHDWMHVNPVAGGDFNMFAQGDIAMMFEGFYVVNMVNGKMEEDFGVVPLPMGPDVDHHYYPMTALISWVMPANVENPEGLVELHQFLWPEAKYAKKLEEYFEARVRDRNSFEVMMTAHENWSGAAFDLEYVIGWGEGGFFPAVNEVIQGNKSPAAAMKEIEPTIQAKIDEMFGQ